MRVAAGTGTQHTPRLTKQQANNQKKPHSGYVPVASQIIPNRGHGHGAGGRGDLCAECSRVAQLGDGDQVADGSPGDGLVHHGAVLLGDPVQVEPDVGLAVAAEVVRAAKATGRDVERDWNKPKLSRYGQCGAESERRRQATRTRGRRSPKPNLSLTWPSSTHVRVACGCHINRFQAFNSTAHPTLASATDTAVWGAPGAEVDASCSAGWK